MSILDDCPGEGYKLCRKKLHWYVPGNSCPGCAKTYAKQWRQKNKENIKQQNRNWRKNNKQKVKTHNKKYYEKNLQKIKQTRKQNKAALNAWTAKRRAAKKQAIAPWANLCAIKNIYKEAVEMTKLTGIKHHVDHIYPLHNKYFCGLHVETNLQILTAKENLRKANKTWPGQLDCQKE